MQDAVCMIRVYALTAPAMALLTLTACRSIPIT